MKTADFDYSLPHELIAQYPLEARDACRLLHLDRKSGAVSDRIFKDLPDFINPHDILVFNDTKVMPARLFCRKKTGGKVELLLTEPLADGAWNALVRPGRGLKAGDEVMLESQPSLTLTITSVRQDGSRTVSPSGGRQFSILEMIETFGVMALPHYIKRSAVPNDSQTYQTIFAKNNGAIASPTAGLHFTEAIMDAVKTRGGETAFVTLHVGIGTFSPVKVDDPQNHRMHSERFDICPETAERINNAKNRGGRIIAVGTTVVRVLESCASERGTVVAGCGATDIFILPGYRFKVVDGMITNFHVPRSTLLMLVSAFAGREAVLFAYNHAAKERYRFFSYGDAMVIS